VKKSNYSLYLAGMIGENKYLENEEMASASPPTAGYNSPEFKSWLSKFEKKFPGGSYPGMSREDQGNLYTGRIILVLDEFGMTDKWPQYAGMADLEQMIKNYEDLVLKLVGSNYPEMLDAYKQWHGID
jgi:hypothetical protein